ncbi:hypothetical protein ABZ589_16115, partial [Streptomyces sp. NPDC013313]
SRPLAPEQVAGIREALNAHKAHVFDDVRQDAPSPAAGEGASGVIDAVRTGAVRVRTASI